MCKAVAAEDAHQRHPLAVEENFIAACQALGALLFVVGSVFFIEQAAVDDWVPPYRLGSAWWVAGCIPYFFTIPHFCRSDWLSAWLQLGGPAGYFFGCSLAFVPECCIPLAAINILFCIGSSCLIADPIIIGWRESPSACSRDGLVIIADFWSGFFFSVASADSDQLLRQLGAQLRQRGANCS